ncbi:MAG TPA: c-type cytochrome [Acidimicrobiia bacterium]|nr:c-type cytochrome [Acidimicrobiia bacterium]
MTADVIIVLAVVAGIIWLGLMLVAALRNRGGAEEVSPNLKPGIDDQQLETKRLEGGQKAAIAFSAFLAISLPLYFLGENSRQEGFVEEFAEASVERGEHLVAEFGCYDCHGPLGVGGSAPFVEPRSGVSVSWDAPRLDDIFYRYDADEVNFWVTFGRGNTPMPAWGLAGGGPMNEKQVEDVVNYLATIQIPQQEAVNLTTDRISTQLSRLDNAETTVRQAIVDQAQIVNEIHQAPEDIAVIEPLADRAAEVLGVAGEGIDTDGDGLSDIAETELSEISAQAVEHFRVIEPLTLDPETPDADMLDQVMAEMESALVNDPIFEVYLERIETALAADEIGEESPDTDGDGISDAGEGVISGLIAEASGATVPSSINRIDLDPTNPETTGDADLQTASGMVGGLESAAINIRVAVDNVDRILPQQEAGLEFLVNAAEEAAWEIDIAGVASAMGVDEEEAARAVGLFNGYCARCHTASFSAGVPYTQEAGSGGFGPALWDGRPVVQFGEAPPEGSEEPDLLVEFLINGSEAQEPYGLNGFGSGRMPGFGPTLDRDDLELLARYLRSGNMDGMEE